MTAFAECANIIRAKTFADAAEGENMMIEDPTVAIERIYREMYAKVESATTASSAR